MNIPHDIKKRLSLYGFGFAMGIGLVFFFLGGKNSSCNWMPNARMLQIIRSKQITYSTEVQNKINSVIIDSTDISQILIDGDIDFSKSQVKNNPCRKYLINGEIKQQEAILIVKICDSIATIETVELK
ncbi:MAG: hypothetical protein L3J08_00710 [Flavobacteriaceae bacterium]|nr:hypothetical protein [Flavobacteriaceae bacterium]